MMYFNTEFNQVLYTMTKSKPFWKEKSLSEMSRDEWESLCDHCGKCCLLKLQDEEVQEDEDSVYYTNVICNLFDKSNGHCSDYWNREERVKWLWASRFFKTRKDAVEAINGGKVHLNGARIKPSRNVQINDKLQITRNNEKYSVTVLGLNDKRRPAKEAQLLYEEDEQSIEARETEREIRRINNASVAMPSTRPNKKQRRQIDRFKGSEKY